MHAWMDGCMDGRMYFAPETAQRRPCESARHQRVEKLAVSAMS